MYKEVCKQDMKTLEIYPESWEDIAADRSSWRCLLHKQLKEGEEKITNKAIENRTRQKEKKQLTLPHLLTSAPHVARTAIPALAS